MGNGRDSGSVLLVTNADGCSTTKAGVARGGGVQWKYVGLSQKCDDIVAEGPLNEPAEKCQLEPVERISLQDPN